MMFGFRPSAWPSTSSKRRYYHHSSKKGSIIIENSEMDLEKLEISLVDKLINKPCYITLHRFIEEAPTDTHRNLRKAYGISAISQSFSSEERMPADLFNEILDENGNKKNISPCFVLDIKNITSIEDSAWGYSYSSKMIVGRCALIYTNGLPVSSWKVKETAEEVRALIEEADKRRHQEILSTIRDLRGTLEKKGESL